MNNNYLTKPLFKSIMTLLFFITTLVAGESLWAQIRIMPLGDSITRGVIGSPDEIGYRRLLYLDLINSGYDVNFVGYRPDGFLLDFDRDHEGHGGFLTQEIALNIEGYLDINPADIILLHIGTNDVDLFSTEDPTQVEAILNAIDNWESVPGNNEIIVILAKIINQQGHLCPNDSVTTRFNNNVEAMALNRIADRIFIVDMECSAGFDYNFDMVDQIHPNQSGYDNMAATWFADGLLIILPMADAGSDLNTTEGNTVQLDGSSSHVPQVPNVNFSVIWDQIVGAGPNVNLDNPNSLTPSFTAPQVDAGGAVLQFKLTISDADNSNISDEDIVDVTIVNVPVPVGTAVTVEDVSAIEGTGLEFTVTLNNAVAGGFDVDVTLSDGTATGGAAPLTAPEDYANDAVTLNFVGTAGETQTFTVATLDDADVEGNETFTVTLSASNANVADSDTAVGTITDNEPTITVEDVTAIEGSGLAFTVALNNAVAGGFGVNVTFVDGTATGGAAPLTAPEDYANDTVTLNFAGIAGETHTFIVATLDDAVDEGNETFTVNLSASNANVADSDTAVGTITDNDNAVANAVSNGGGGGGGGCFIQTVSGLFKYDLGESGIDQAHPGAFAI